MEWNITIRHHLTNHRPRKESEQNWFRRQPSIYSTIQIAWQAKDERGKQYSHQRRIDKCAIKKVTEILLENAESLNVSPSFHFLWLKIRDLVGSISGIGDQSLRENPRNMLNLW